MCDTFCVDGVLNTNIFIAHGWDMYIYVDKNHNFQTMKKMETEEKETNCNFNLAHERMKQQSKPVNWQRHIISLRVSACACLYDFVCAKVNESNSLDNMHRSSVAKNNNEYTTNAFHEYIQHKVYSQSSSSSSSLKSKNLSLYAVAITLSLSQLP